MNSHWLIEDERVIQTLRANGYTCEKPIPPTPKAAISFHFQDPEEERRATEANTWYNTSCPILWNSRYTLPDGTVLQTVGTKLQLADPPADE